MNSFENKKQSKLEKDLMRPLYDHYRKVKRLLVKNNSSVSYYLHLMFDFFFFV